MKISFFYVKYEPDEYNCDFTVYGIFGFVAEIAGMKNE